MAMTCIGSLSLAPDFAASDENSGLPLLLEVFLNGESTELIGTFTRYPDGRIAALRGELANLGIQPPEDEGEPEDLVLLDELKGLVYVYDEPRQRLDVEIEVDRRATNTIDPTGSSLYSTDTRSDFGAKFNYLLYGSSRSYELMTGAGLPQRIGLDSASLQLDATVFSPLGNLEQTGIVNYSSNDGFSVRRHNTTLVHPRPDRSMIFRAGDVVSGSQAWSRAVRIGGLQIERDFSLRPDLVTTPLPSVSGTAAVPTTIDVFLGNVRTFSQDVPVGPYVIRNIPGLTGKGTARVVVQDASGRLVETELPFYVSPNLLK